MKYTTVLLMEHAISKHPEGNDIASASVSRGVASPNPGGGGPTSGKKVPIFQTSKNTPIIRKKGKTYSNTLHFSFTW